MQTVDGRLYVIAGKSRSGKTAGTAQDLKRNKYTRIIAWDPEDQWSQLPGWTRITTQRELLAAIQRNGPAKLAYVPGGDLKEQFEFWAGCAFYWGRYHGPCAVIAEELADVTTTAKAPGSWGILLRRGLKRGIDIYAISQRWAEADKTALGNVTEYVLYAMEPMDQVYMSRRTGIPVEELAALRSSEQGEVPVIKEFIRLKASSRKITKGKLSFR